MDLAWELFEETRWKEAHLESRRVLNEEKNTEALLQQARLLSSLCILRQNPGDPAALETLSALWTSASTPLATRCLAAYEAGRAWDGRHPSPEALDALSFAYLHARDTELFWRAGCSLYYYLQQDAAARRNAPGLWQSLLSCRSVWPPAVWQESRPDSARSSIGALPGKWIVSFYRSQISSAIGARCDLLPSCSEYFLQASRKHGLLGIPIMADRFIRESSVVATRRNPVVMPNGRIRYADPLADHDEWLSTP
ncbi:MAG: membrane protein insertion efficiency factor YidD [Verrucomicrobiota bacterium]|nr:membrane protein insertion efficiency factor YidD [Verrucomicrobiota bacterium]